MADVEVNVIVGEKCRSVLGRLAALDRQPEMAAAKRMLGTMALQDERLEFADRAKPGSGVWPPLSTPAVVLRQAGRGMAKIVDAADVDARRSRIHVLRDSNRLFASLQPSGHGNVFDVLPGAVRVGTHVSYAALQQRGGSSAFRFGAAEEARFEKNVSKTLAGFRKPAALKSGNRRKWKESGKKSPWNPFFFRLRGALRKMAGKSFTVPARPFIIEPKPEWTARWARIIENAIGKITR